MSDSTASKATVSFVAFVGLASIALSIMFTVTYLNYKEEHSVGTPKFVMIDTVKIMRKKTEQLIAKTTIPDPVVYREEANTFASELNSILTEYKENGYWVMNSSAVIVTSNAFDDTDKVAKRLGIDLKKEYDRGSDIRPDAIQGENK